MKQAIYLDFASATPMDEEVIRAMQPYYSEKFYNPSSISLASRNVKHDLDKARTKIAMLLGARQSEIYFTAGATEANNLAIQGVMRRFPDSEVLVSTIEHQSVLAPASLYKAQLVPVTKQGIVDCNILQKMISPKTALISIMMVNNELGSIQPIKQISAIIKNIRLQRQNTKNKLPIYLHTDAAQAGNLFDLHTHRLGVDLMSLNGGKIYGPKQSGVLFVKTGVGIEPIIVGGGQEGGLRSGTENVAGAIGLSKALDMSQKIHAKEFKRLSVLHQYFVTEIQSKFKFAIVNATKKYQSPQNLSVTFPGFDNERLMMELDEKGIQTAVGSACSASSDEPSHVLRAIGLTDENARSTLRFSMGRQTTKQQIDQTVKELVALTVSNR